MRLPFPCKFANQRSDSVVFRLRRRALNRLCCVVRRILASPQMHLDKKFLQRALLAFTTGLFLACAARVSAAQPSSTAATTTSQSR